MVFSNLGTPVEPEGVIPPFKKAAIIRGGNFMRSAKDIFKTANFSKMQDNQLTQSDDPGPSVCVPQTETVIKGRKVPILSSNFTKIGEWLTGPNNKILQMQRQMDAEEKKRKAEDALGRSVTRLASKAVDTGDPLRALSTGSRSLLRRGTREILTDVLGAIAS